MCWRTAAWCSTARPRRWARTRTSRSSIWACPRAAANRSARASITGGASAGWRSLVVLRFGRCQTACDLMGDLHYDSLEIRDPDDRERDLLVRLPDLIAMALTAPRCVTHLSSLVPNAMT